jgi:hypothetical protein
MRSTSAPSPNSQNHLRRIEFDAQADKRYAKVLASGMTIPWSDMRAYLEQRISGKPAVRPAARKLPF